MIKFYGIDILSIFPVILSYLIAAFVKPNLQVWIIDRKMFISRFRMKNRMAKCIKCFRYSDNFIAGFHTTFPIFHQSSNGAVSLGV